MAERLSRWRQGGIFVPAIWWPQLTSSRTANRGGLPGTPNGLAPCQLRHGAFDRHMVGVRPDLVMELRRDLRLEVDGPMLRHGLQELQCAPLRIRTRAAPRDRPDAGLLEERQARFRSAS